MERAGGGAGRNRLKGVGEEGLGNNTWSTLGKSQLDKSPATAKAPRGGGVQVRGVGLVVAVPGVKIPQVIRSPVQPILGVGEGGQPMVAAGYHHQQHAPLCNRMVSQRASPSLPQGRPRLHRYLEVL